jgi:hypothetical protein
VLGSWAALALLLTVTSHVLSDSMSCSMSCPMSSGTDTAAGAPSVSLALFTFGPSAIGMWGTAGDVCMLECMLECVLE